jgi:restriction system protein
MAIPSFQDITLPVLRLTGDGKEHSKKEFLGILAKQFNLTAAEREELLESGRQGRFDNRTAWAISYLRNALLIETTVRGRFKIAPRGLELLKAPPPRIDIPFLMRYEEFRQFRTTTKKETKPAAEAEEIVAAATPTEAMDTAYKQLRQAVASELLQRMKSSSPKFFENLVVDVLLTMGYGGSRKESGEVVGRSGDGGIDGVIKEDKLGLDMIYVQAKRWEGTVGRPTVQAFAGSLDGHRARKGILISTSSFSADAEDFVDRIDKKIVLIDGERLAQLMIDHRVGVTPSMEYVLCKIDADYFEEEA